MTIRDPINICKEAFIETVCNKTQLGWSEQVPLKALRQSTSWETEPKLISSPKHFFLSVYVVPRVCAQQPQVEGTMGILGGGCAAQLSES